MKQFKCEEMMCDHCVSRIDGALKEVNIDHQIDLGTKTVTIEGGVEIETQAIEVLEDLGFTPVAQ